MPFWEVVTAAAVLMRKRVSEFEVSGRESTVRASVCGVCGCGSRQIGLKTPSRDTSDGRAEHAGRVAAVTLERILADVVQWQYRPFVAT